MEEVEDIVDDGDDRRDTCGENRVTEGITVTLVLLKPRRRKVNISKERMTGTNHGAGRTLVRYITVITTSLQELTMLSIVFNCLDRK